MEEKQFVYESNPVENCKLCGSAEKVVFLSPTEFGDGKSSLVRCSNCGMTYIDPAPTKDALKKFYEDTYLTPEYRKIDGASIPDPRQELLYTFQVMEKHLDEIEKRKTPPGNILDVGCSHGAFMLEANSRGWTTVGVEPFQAAAEFCKNSLGLNVHNKDIMDAELPENHYDVISMWEVIEHVFDPVSVMKKIWKLAKPGGILIMSSPNAESPASLITRGQWVGLKFPTHLQFFGYGTLPRLLLESGWKSIEVKSGGGYPGQIMAIAECMKK